MISINSFQFGAKTSRQEVDWYSAEAVSTE
jgi:hypothetical protein